MKRIHWFEFEDIPWLPEFIRSGITKLIVVLHQLSGTSDVIGALLLKARKVHPFKQIVDIGSGSGGIMPEAFMKMNEASEDKCVRLLLTDLYPNLQAAEKFNKGPNANVTYARQPVDAMAMTSMPEGLKTMINSFHHMRPEVAKKILQSAQEHQQAILIYEMGENKIPTWLWILLLPLSLLIMIIMVWLMTPFVKPLTWHQLLFTYLIPVIPICYAWDGQISMARFYTFEDIDVLMDGFPSIDRYKWETGYGYKANGNKLGYYILGWPL